jgi:two-component system sensor histidine kinase DesK
LTSRDSRDAVNGLAHTPGLGIRPPGGHYGILLSSDEAVRRRAPATVGPGDVAARDDGVDRATRRGVILLLLFLFGPVPGMVFWAVTDGMRGPSLVALVALRALAVAPQLVHSLPSLRRVRARYWRWTFTAQLVLAFAPHLAFGAHWFAVGLLAGSALLLFRTPTSWVVVALVTAAEGGIQLAYGADLTATLILLVDGSLVSALAVYGLTRLLDVLGDLHATRTAAARAAAGQERLRAAREVFRRLGPQLSTIAQSAELARRVVRADPAPAEAAVIELGRVARRALSDAREAARTFRDAGPDGAYPPEGVRVPAEPRLAFGIVVVMSLTGAGANLASLVTNQRPGLAAVTAAAAGLAALVALQLYHGAPRTGGVPPRFRWWTLPAQVLLVYLPVPVFGTDWIGMSCYLAACVLVVLRPPAAWLALVVILGADLPILAALSVPSRFIAWEIVASGWTVVIFYAPMLLAASAVQLRSARTELTRMLLVRERLGVARDVHDLLGSSLSAVALKADLAQRLLQRDPQRAQAELADAADLARRAMTEARSLSGEESDTSLAQELVSARSMLSAASIRTDIAPFPGGLPARADAVLAIVVREAVTNVLRHSAARHCAISLSLDGGTASLRITNDGVTIPAGTEPGPGTGTGTGIGNLSARVHALGGQFSATPDGPRGFGLAAEVPLDAVIV